MLARRVLITAGAGGIGRAIADRFLRDGHQAHVCDIDSEALAATLAALPGLRGSVTDVGDSRQVEAMFAEAIGWLGGLDVLINNHGIAGPRGYLEDLDPAEWDRCIRVNLSGMFYTMKLAVPHFKRQRAGCIINLITTSVRTGLPQRAAYVAGKAGALGLTRNAARELGPWNIRVNAVLPGFMNNDRGRGVLARVARDKGVPLEVMEAEALRFVSMRTWIEMREVAAACAFLASDEASHISGQELGVCGNVEWEE
jgi:NAD(P)-dependent dehydrogenase (short-subunit alcohol dehydrogenase family)